MKKITVITGMVLMALILLLTSVSSQSATPAPTQAAPSGSARVPFDTQVLPRYLVSPADPGGSAWVLASGWATIISKYTSIKASVTQLAGFKASIEPMRKGEQDYMWMGPSQPVAAYLGKYEPEGIKKLRLRTMISPRGMEPGLYGIWVLKSSSIQGGKDLKGKKIGVVPSTVWSPEIPEGIMAAHGWTQKDWTRVDYASGNAVYDALRDRKIDAACQTAGSKTNELDKDVGVRQIALTQAEIDAIVKIDPALMGGMSTEGYMGAGPSHLTIVSYSGFWCRADLNEKAAYTMVKALFEHIDEYYQIHERCREMELKSAVDKNWFAPYHPGVIRYYKEMGIWGPEQNKKQLALIEAERKLYGNVIDEEAFKDLGILK